MDNDASSAGAGWTVARSIALELDVAIHLVGADAQGFAVPEDLVDAFAALPAKWREQRDRFVGSAGLSATPLVSQLAMLCGRMLDDDFGECTLALRQLDADAVRRALRDDTQAGDELGAAVATLRRRLRARFGLPTGRPASALAPALATLPRILRDGELHAEFWHWLDEFYYRAYEPWRQTRLAEMDAQASRAAQALGAAHADAGVPATDWLPQQNPLRHQPELSEAVGAGRLPVVFWVQPLGMWDLWTIVPSDSPAGAMCLLSFDEPGEVFETFRGHAEALATRLDALSDPTRLLILRLIRQVDADNTTIADMLELARPTVSIHAKQLREAGLVESRREGRSVKHRLDADALRRLFRQMEQFLGLAD